MDGFAIYLNPSPYQFSKQPQMNYLEMFSKSIAFADFLPKDYQYCK
jgi:hypothetical protein